MYVLGLVVFVILFFIYRLSLEFLDDLTFLDILEFVLFLSNF